MRGLFVTPIAILLSCTFVYWAFRILPLSGSTQNDIMYPVIKTVSCFVGLWTISRTFDYFRILAGIISVRKDLYIQNALYEGLTLGKVFFLILSFILMLGSYGGYLGNQQRAFFNSNVFTMLICFSLVYHLRDVVASLAIYSDNFFKLGDIVEIDKVCGKAMDLSLRRFTLQQKDGSLQEFPSSVVWDCPVINYSGQDKRPGRVSVFLKPFNQSKEAFEGSTTDRARFLVRTAEVKLRMVLRKLGPLNVDVDDYKVEYRAAGALPKTNLRKVQPEWVSRNLGSRKKRPKKSPTPHSVELTFFTLWVNTAAHMQIRTQVLLFMTECFQEMDVLL